MMHRQDSRLGTTVAVVAEAPGEADLFFPRSSFKHIPGSAETRIFRTIPELLSQMLLAEATVQTGDAVDALTEAAWILWRKLE